MDYTQSEKYRNNIKELLTTQNPHEGMIRGEFVFQKGRWIKKTKPIDKKIRKSDKDINVNILIFALNVIQIIMLGFLDLNSIIK